MQLFSADTIHSVFKKKLNFFLTSKRWKNGPQKLLIIGPGPFIPQSSPYHSPQPKIDFPYHEISGPDICSLICDSNPRHMWSIKNKESQKSELACNMSSRFWLWAIGSRDLCQAEIETIVCQAEQIHKMKTIFTQNCHSCCFEWK